MLHIKGTDLLSLSLCIVKLCFFYLETKETEEQEGKVWTSTRLALNNTSLINHNQQEGRERKRDLKINAQRLLKFKRWTTPWCFNVVFEPCFLCFVTSILPPSWFFSRSLLLAFENSLVSDFEKKGILSTDLFSQSSIPWAFSLLPDVNAYKEQSTLILSGPALSRVGNHSHSGKVEEN